MKITDRIYLSQKMYDFADTYYKEVYQPLETAAREAREVFSARTENFSSAEAYEEFREFNETNAARDAAWEVYEGMLNVRRQLK